MAIRNRRRARVKNAVVFKSPALTEALIEELLQQQKAALEAAERLRSLQTYRTEEVLDESNFYGVPRTVEAVNDEEAVAVAQHFVDRTHQIPRAA